MIFYCHDLHEKEDCFSWHRQKGQALASAKEHARTVPRGSFIEVEKVTLVDLTSKELVLAVLNGSGYVAERETIAEVKGKLKVSKQPRAKAKKKKKKGKGRPTPPLKW